MSFVNRTSHYVLSGYAMHGREEKLVASAKESDADRTYRRYCPVRAWTRLRFLEGARDRRWLWSETSTHSHW